MSAPLRPEHPRPDRVREHWMTLNGQWDFAFDPQNQGLRKAWYRPENPWDGERLFPGPSRGRFGKSHAPLPPLESPVKLRKLL